MLSIKIENSKIWLGKSLNFYKNNLIHTYSISIESSISELLRSIIISIESLSILILSDFIASKLKNLLRRAIILAYCFTYHI